MEMKIQVIGHMYLDACSKEGKKETLNTFSLVLYMVCVSVSVT